MPDYMPASDPEFDLWQKTLATKTKENLATWGASQHCGLLLAAMGKYAWQIRSVERYSKLYYCRLNPLICSAVCKCNAAFFVF